MQHLLERAESASGILVTPALAWSRQTIEAAISVAEQREHLAQEIIGSTLGDRYRIEGLLGRGGHALVFLAIDCRIGHRKVVVKILDATADHQEWLHRKFRQEIAILGRISHPGVVGIRDCGQLPGGRPFLVLDFVDGVTLRERLRSPIASVEAAKIIRKVGTALKVAHDQGITHRDIKPENVMVADGLERGRVSVKLIDFGIAQLREADRQGATTMISGTMKYMAPEQFIGLASPASDIYSLAVVCFEIMTGSTPYEETDPGQLAAEDHRRFIERVSKAKGIPDSARPILARALAFDPSRRPKDAETFANLVAGALSDRSAKRLSSFLRHPGGRQVAPIVAVAVVLAIGASNLAFRDDTESGTAPPTHRIVPLTSYPGEERDPSPSPD